MSLYRIFYTTGIEHSPPSATATGWERKLWHMGREKAEDGW
jgi:hypothetical protein